MAEQLSESLGVSEDGSAEDQDVAGSGETGYEELFAGFSASVEKVLIRTALVLALLLAAGQVLLLIPAVREALVRVERLEGVPFGAVKTMDLPIYFASREESMV